MTDLPRFLLDWACSVILFLVSYVRYYCKLRRHSGGHHNNYMAAAAAVPTTPTSEAASSPSPTPRGAWSKRAADHFPADQVTIPPTSKRSKDAAAASAGIRIERECAESPTYSAAPPAILLRRRPSMIVIPEQSASTSSARREFEKEAAARKIKEESDSADTEGRGYWVASRKGSRRAVIEDGHAAITNINGDPTKAYFGVFDGHGGRAAVDFVERNLGSNLVTALDKAEEEAIISPADAIRSAYADTDRDFVSKDLHGGACVATVLMRGGVLYAANAGDCRVVISCNGGEARRLTNDQRPGREDERKRIESTGGFVSCYGDGAVWRVQDSLSVTRSIGDAQLKQWIIPDPEVTELKLKRGGRNDQDFLIMASDGLWDHVNDQEAVHVVLANGGCGARAARALVDIPLARGGRDDVTVMLVPLHGFVV